MHPAVEQIRQYLQLIALQFVQHLEQAELRVAESPQGDGLSGDQLLSALAGKTFNLYHKLTARKLKS